jgi:hypothetical protein
MTSFFNVGGKMRKGYYVCLTIATRIVLTSALITVVQPLPQATAQSSHSQAPCCSIVAQALRDYGHLKGGIKRSEVEKYFQLSGGLSGSNRGLLRLQGMPSDSGLHKVLAKSHIRARFLSG